MFTIHRDCLPLVSDRDSWFTLHFWQKLMQNLQIKLKMTTSYHHQTNGQMECYIHTICQCLDNLTNFIGTHWVNQLSHVQLNINAALGNSTGSLPFNIIYGQNVLLLPAVRIYSTIVPSAKKHVSSWINVQEEAQKALELARVCQTRVSRDPFKPAPPLVPGQDTVLVCSASYCKALGNKAKIILP
jgi:hypothetical protein